MPQYTIAAVSPAVRDYNTTQGGPMKAYKLKFQETGDTIVELSQKPTTPPPVQGQTLNGTIDMSAQFGPKFKKEFNQGGGFQQTTGQSTQGPTAASTSGSGKFQSDPFTMYLSYAKDVAVALIGSKAGYDEEQFAKVLEDVIKGGEVLYDGRPGAETTKAKDNLPNDDFDGSEQIDLSTVNTLFPDTDPQDKPIDIKDVPF